MTEKEFKDALEAKLLVLLDKGRWVASMKDNVNLLSSVRNHSNHLESFATLQIFLYAESIDVVTAGHIVTMNSSILCDKANKVYHNTNAAQKIQGQRRLQIGVMTSVDGLLEPLLKEPM